MIAEPGLNRRSMNAPSRVALAAVAALSIFGCVTEGPPLPEAPKAPPAQPAGLAPDKIVLSVSQYGEDTDRNGYYDTLTATVFLFDYFDSTYALSIAVPGEFKFRLATGAGAPLCEWKFDSAQSQRVCQLFGPGPGFVFTLDLAAVKMEMTDAREGILTCEFQGVTGPPIVTRGGQTVIVGPTR